MKLPAFLSRQFFFMPVKGQITVNLFLQNRSFKQSLLPHLLQYEVCLKYNNAKRERLLFLVL